VQKEGRTNVLTPGVHKSQATSCMGGNEILLVFSNVGGS